MSTVEALVGLQANAAAMYAQAHGYHWNVKGILFKELHAFFLEIYEDVYNSIDPIAENIRKLGADAPFGLVALLRNATVSINDDPNLSPVAMLTELAGVNSVLVAQYKAAFRTASEEDEQAIANFFAERLNQHQFWNWQLKATLQNTVF